ncbi:hypothetical protein [Candidatus Uabimicrobium amorphum]|uniref:Uncharacterized protein n=1 Tax=Uabimicrobium amorphum TaxID=2596890 RepID=A0A5S9IW07_UABAM|nr:hypothetical protein [Candidatus Uabimicrobium amorphum]BBM88301.1 hypothetical protein UABAM_06722 [Candidatus Uabimicrobium amorphum]
MMSTRPQKYEKLFAILRENSRKDKTYRVVSDHELEIKVPLSKSFIFIGVFCLSASVLAISNLLAFRAVVASTIWMFLFLFAHLMAIRESGIYDYILIYIKGLTTTRVLKIDDDGVSIQFGYKLWRYYIVDFQAKLNEVGRVSWYMGQASSRVCEDVNDWFLGIHTKKEERSHSFFINDNNLSRKECKKLGSAIIIFLLYHGVDLTQTDENCWQHNADAVFVEEDDSGKEEPKEYANDPNVEEMVFSKEGSLLIFSGIVIIFLFYVSQFTTAFLPLLYLALFSFSVLCCGCCAPIFATLLIVFEASIWVSFTVLFIVPIVVKLMTARYKARSFYEVFVDMLTRKVVVVINKNDIALFYKWGKYRYGYFKAAVTDVVAVNEIRFRDKFCLCILDGNAKERKFCFCVKEVDDIERFVNWLLDHKSVIVRKNTHWHRWQAPHRDDDVVLYYELVNAC